MSEKRLAVSLFFLFALSAAYLFSVNERGLDPDRDKNWWSLAFAEPEEERSLDFTVANHTATASFRYVVTAENAAPLATGELLIDPGQSATQPVLLPETIGRGRITITVTHDGRDETIYRAL